MTLIPDSRDINQDLALKPSNMNGAGFNYTLQTDGQEADVDDSPDRGEIRWEMQYIKNPKAALREEEIAEAGIC